MAGTAETAGSKANQQVVLFEFSSREPAGVGSRRASFYYHTGRGNTSRRHNWKLGLATPSLRWLPSHCPVCFHRGRKSKPMPTISRDLSYASLSLSILNLPSSRVLSLTGRPLPSSPLLDPNVNGCLKVIAFVAFILKQAVVARGNIRHSATPKKRSCLLRLPWPEPVKL